MDRKQGEKEREGRIDEGSREGGTERREGWMKGAGKDRHDNCAV